MIDSNNIKSLYRFSEVNVDWMNGYLFGPEIIETIVAAIKNIIKLKTFLKLVGNPGFQVAIGEDLGIHQIIVPKKKHC